jgi:hypothetical protein
MITSPGMIDVATARVLATFPEVLSREEPLELIEHFARRYLDREAVARAETVAGKNDL